MDDYQIMSLLGRITPGNADPYTVTRLYAQTLAAISDRLTDDELRRFLICGAYLCHKTKGSGKEVDFADEYDLFKGKTQLH